MWGIAIITAVYLLANLAYLSGLGVAGMAASQAVAADLMRQSFGQPGAALVSILVAVSAITSANATILTGARTTYALGRDFRIFRPLGRWRSLGHTPANALIAQGAIALALVVLGSFTRSGFATMVEYTAPVFWAFFLLTGFGLIVLRVRDPDTSRPFRVPLYPVTPLLFCASSAYMLWSSLAHTGVGALIGVAVLLAGVSVLVMGPPPRKFTDRDGGSDDATESRNSGRRALHRAGDLGRSPRRGLELAPPRGRAAGARSDDESGRQGRPVRCDARGHRRRDASHGAGHGERYRL